MYQITKRGNIYFNNVKIPQDENNIAYQQYLIDKDIVGYSYVETTPEEIIETNIELAILIDLDYTDRISELMEKHNEKYLRGMRTGIPYIIQRKPYNNKQI